MITIRNLHHLDARYPAPEIPSLDIQSGEIVAFVGPTGSGKIALFDMLVGRIQPTIGDIRVLDMDPYRNQRKLMHQLGVLNSEDQLYGRFSVRYNMEFHCHLYGESIENIGAILESVGLRDHAEVRVDRLSASLARRLSFARSIVHNPKILFLFQPFLRCDSPSISILSDLLIELADANMTVVLFGDNASNFNRICTTIYQVSNGSLTQNTAEPNHVWQPSLLKIPAKQSGRVILIDSSKVYYISVEGELTFIHTEEGKTTSHLGIGELEKRLLPHGFFRAHRGYLVNLQHINSVIPYTRDSFTLTLDSEQPVEIPLSKKAAQRLRQLLNY